MPGSIRSLIVAAATAAPVCPALTTACASPDFTRSTAREMEESFFLRTASSPLSDISTTCVVWTISNAAVVARVLLQLGLQSRRIAGEDTAS